MKTDHATLQKRWAEKKLQDPQWATIARRFADGESAGALADEYGHNVELVRSVVGHGKVREAPSPRMAEAMRMHEGGCSLLEIGRVLKISKQYVHQFLRSRTKMRQQSMRSSGSWAEMIARGEW